MESLVSELALSLADRVESGFAQWYCLDIEAQHLGGISNLLNMTTEAYQVMAWALGWVKPFKGRHGVSHPLQKDVVDAFFASPAIPFELCQAKVPTASKRHWFLRLGPYASEVFTAKEQFKGRRLERVSIDWRRLDGLKVMVNRLQDDFNAFKAKVDHELLMEEASEVRLPSQEDRRKAFRDRLCSDVDSLVASLSFEDVSSCMEEGEDLYGIVHRLTTQRLARTTREGSIACGTQTLEASIDFDPNRYQILCRLGAPFDCRYLAYIVQEILLLEEETNASILSRVKARNGRQSPCLVVRKDPKWNRSTISFVLAHSSMTAGTMAVQLLRQDEEDVIESLKKEGIRIITGPMSALTTQAMVNMAALGDNSLRVLRRFSRAHWGLTMFASTATMRAISGSQGLAPLCLSAMVEKKRVRYNIKRVQEVVLHELSCRATILADTRTIDVVISGDHGKGFYRMIALILIWQSNTVIKPVRVTVEIASMRCRKDTAEVLETIVPAINDSLENLGISRVLVQQNSGVNLVTAENAHYQGSIPVRVYLAGDLAWVSDILGKTNMAGHWCPYCKINKETRQAANHTKAELWSIPKLQDHLEYLESDLLPRTPTAQDILGVKCRPLLTNVPLRNLVPPVLHMELGLVNYIIDYMERWIHVLFDPAPSADLEGARLARLDALREKESAKDALEAFYADCQLYSLVSRQEDLGEVLNAEEEEELMDLREEEMAWEDALAEADKSLAKAKATENKLAKSCGRLTRPIILRIEEEVYHAWSIRRPTYHGGDFIGTSCRLIMRLAETIIGSIGELLLAVPEEDRSSDVSDEDIQQFTAAIIRLLQYGDAIFAIARKGEREVVQADRNACTKYIALFCRLWRLIGLPSTIKLHIMEDHLLDGLGNGERLEDATEQQHQIGHSFEVRSRIAQYEKKASVASRQEAVRNNPQVKGEIERVLTETSRLKRKQVHRERVDEETKRRREGRLRLLDDDTEEIDSFPKVDNILLETLQAYAATREEDGNG
jgi:hypothetical protein